MRTGGRGNGGGVYPNVHVQPILVPKQPGLAPGIQHRIRDLPANPCDRQNLHPGAVPNLVDIAGGKVRVTIGTTVFAGLD
jgi:hypothetical protein